MFISRDVPTQHKDLIHDFDFDYYGRRLATCSSDQMMKVWDLKEDGEWHCTASWRTHNGSVWRICWSYPEYGQVIASCSFDRTVTIWEEVITGQSNSNVNAGGLNSAGDDAILGQHQPSSLFSSNPPGKAVGSGNGTFVSHWVKRCNLVDARASVTDVRFCPRYLGLQLATCSTDGMLRIYEASDVMNVSQWTLQQNISTCPNASCLSWSQSRHDPPLLAVGSSCKDSSCGGGSQTTLTNATTGSNPSVSIPSAANRSLLHSSSNALSQTQTTLDSGNNPSINSSNASYLEIFEYMESTRQWVCVEKVYQLTDPVLDVAFAPNMGKSYHTLAVATDQGFVVLCLRRPGNITRHIALSNEDPQSALTIVKNEYSIRKYSEQQQSRGRIWRVNWNVTGTLLCTAGDDGVIRLWMRNSLDTWTMVDSIEPDKPEVFQNTSQQESSGMGGTEGPVHFQKAGPIHHLTKGNVPWH